MEKKKHSRFGYYARRFEIDPFYTCMCQHNLSQFDIAMGWIKTPFMAMEVKGSIPCCNILFMSS